MRLSETQKQEAKGRKGTMAASNMMQHTIYLDASPGGIVPELHLKKGENSTELNFLIVKDDGLSGAAYKRAVFLAKLPDGTDFFATGFTGWDNHRISVTMYNTNVKKLAVRSGRFRLTMTILNTGNQVNRGNYLDYDMLTVLPLTVIVH